MTKKILAIYLILIHFLVLLILVKSNFIDRVERKIGTKTSNQEFSNHYYEMLAYHKRMDGNIPQGAIIFIGDSLTQSLAVSAIVPSAVNYGIGNDTSVGGINRLNKYQSINRAKFVVITIGINDLKIRGEKEVALNFVKIIKSIPATTKIIFNSIHPVDENYIHCPNRKNKIINYLNLELKRICTEYSNVYYLDISNLLTDNTGNLSNNYHIGDGVHLNSKGYEIWINSLSKEINEIGYNEK